MAPLTIWTTPSNFARFSSLRSVRTHRAVSLKRLRYAFAQDAGEWAQLDMLSGRGSDNFAAFRAFLGCNCLKLARIRLVGSAGFQYFYATFLKDSRKFLRRVLSSETC